MTTQLLATAPIWNADAIQSSARDAQPSGMGMPSRDIRLHLALLLALLLPACDRIAGALPGSQPKSPFQVSSGKALYEEKCRTVAGEKIYKKVEGVEGILLLKVRPEAGGRQWADPMWPGAAFARESRADEYITTFLGYEHSGLRTAAVTSAYRGYIGTDYQGDNPSNLPGYRYVDVIDPKDGMRYRYSGSTKIVGRKDTGAPGVQMALKNDPNFDLNVYRWTLDIVPAPEPSPRYAVTFEDHVVPEERALWVASSTVKVIDLKTSEMLAELTRYTWSPGRPNSSNPAPWLTALRCPDHAVGTNAATRKFVDQVLIPKKER